MNNLPSCLRLEIQVLERFEHESGGELLVATLSLLEVSARGLLETELLVMLADYDNLMPQEKGGEKRESRAVFITVTKNFPFLHLISKIRK